MRLPLPATLLAITLFLGGCFHVPPQPLTPPPATTTDKTVEEVREAIQLGDIKKRLLAGEDVAGLKYDPSLDKDWKQYEFPEVGLRFKLPTYYIISTGNEFGDYSPLWLEIIEDPAHPSAPGRITDTVPFLIVKNKPTDWTGNEIPPETKEIRLYKQVLESDVYYKDVYEFSIDNKIVGQFLDPQRSDGRNISLEMLSKEYRYLISNISLRKDDIGNFLINLEIK